MSTSNPVTPTIENTLILTDTGANTLIVGGAIGATAGTGTVKAGTVNDSVGTMATIRAGGIGIASQASLDFIYASSPTQFARLAKGSAYQVPSIDSAGTGWTFVTQQLALVHEASGTNSTAGATIVDSVAITGLTLKDTLYIIVRSANTGSAAAITPSVYNSTDSVSIAAGTTVTNDYAMTTFTVGAQALTKVVTLRSMMAATDGDNGVRATFSTNWTGSWTLALRHGGITAPDTWQWEWAVYKISGQ